MEIANIVTEDKINIGPEFNVVSNYDEIIYHNLPTLIIGYDKVLLYHDKANILNRKINKTTFWTVKRFDNRSIYSSDLEDFITFSFNKYFEQINYVDLDIIQFSNKKMYKIVKKILSLNNFITYRTENDVFYMFSNNIIFGIDLNLIKFVGLNVNKIKNKIITKSVVFIEGNEIFIEYNNDLERLNYDLKYIPVLYSLKNND